MFIVMSLDWYGHQGLSCQINILDISCSLICISINVYNLIVLFGEY